MHIYYESGPPTVTLGVAGTFEKGTSRDIDDKLAEQLLGKKSIEFKKGKKVKAEDKTAAVEEVTNVGN